VPKKKKDKKKKKEKKRVLIFSRVELLVLQTTKKTHDTKYKCHGWNSLKRIIGDKMGWIKYKGILGKSDCTHTPKVARCC